MIMILRYQINKLYLNYKYKNINFHTQNLIMKSQKFSLKQKIDMIEATRLKIGNASRVFEDYIASMSQQIKNHKNSSFLCGYCGRQSKTRFNVNNRFVEAFKTLNIKQKVELYEKTVFYAEQYQKNFQNKQETNKQIQLSIPNPLRFNLLLEGGFTSWQTTNIKIQRFKVQAKDRMSFDLRNYLFRESKKKGVNAYVLEAINQTEPKIIRFCFLNEKQKDTFLPIIKQKIIAGHEENIRRMIKKSQTIHSQLKIPQNNNQDIKQDLGSPSYVIKGRKPLLKDSEQIHEQNANQLHISHNSRIKQKITKRNSQSKISRIEPSNIIKVKGKNIQKISKKKRYKNVFKLLFPDKNLFEIINLNSFAFIPQIQIDNTAKIYSQKTILQNPLGFVSYKVLIQSNLNSHSIAQCLASIINYSDWHPLVIESKIGIVIDSENCLIIHQTLKGDPEFPFNIDMVYIVHCFQYQNSYFIVYKSVKDSTILSEKNTQRVFIEYGAWKISVENHHTTIRGQLKVKFDNDSGNTKLNKVIIKYLSGFSKINDYIREKKNQKKLIKLLKTDWHIDANFIKDDPVNDQSSQNDLKSDQFGNCQSISQEFYSIILEQSNILIKDQSISQQKDQIKQRQQKKPENLLQYSPLLKKSPLNRLQSEVYQKKEKHNNLRQLKQQNFQNQKSQFSVQLNSQGRIILPNNFLKHRFQLQISKSMQDYSKKVTTFENYLLKNHFRQDPDGTLFLYNQQLKSIQDKVVAFIFAKMKQNFLSGKSIINVSLPVTIFKADSNLARLCQAWSLAPFFLQKAAKLNQPIQKFKVVVPFAISSMALYFGCEKPFNPILGQTYQGFIAGCPIYGQQISHHPPISSLLFYGRGYKIYANLQGKVEVRVNSGAGCNDGLINVVFDDKSRIYYNTPMGEMTGMMFGKRVFRFKGHCVFFDLDNRFLLQLFFEDPHGYFSSKKWKQSYQFQGRAVQVTPEFMKQFQKSGFKKKLGQKNIQRQLFTAHGRWPNEVLIDGVLVYNVPKDMPFQFIEQVYPLHSHSNYREDIYYRKIQDLVKSQSQKQRLQVQQRKDRKLRQKKQH